MSTPPNPANGMHLLVIDWDFFFRNPALMADPDQDENVVMYLWDHKEAPLYLTPVVWGGRASGFLRNGLPLPCTTGWQGFWDRFTIRDDAMILYGDSNLEAGRVLPSSVGLDDYFEEGQADAWESVSLWDAHHDSGYKGTGSYEKWLARGRVSCEDWMLVHYGHGSRLDVTYPAWRGAVGVVEPEPLVPVERRVDDGTNPATVYDAVYVCRSGAWVPPWCDDDFTKFLDAAPSRPWLVEAEGWEHPRPDALDEAENEVIIRNLMEVQGGGN